jgi:hypothetical protein
MRRKEVSAYYYYYYYYLQREKEFLPRNLVRQQMCHHNIAISIQVGYLEVPHPPLYARRERVLELLQRVAAEGDHPGARHVCPIVQRHSGRGCSCHRYGAQYTGYTVYLSPTIPLE